MRWCPVWTKYIQGNMKFRWGLSRVHTCNYHVCGAWKRCFRLFKVRCLSKPDPQSCSAVIHLFFPSGMQTNCGDFKPECQFLFSTIRRVWRKSALIVRVGKKKNLKSTFGVWLRPIGSPSGSSYTNLLLWIKWRTFFLTFGLQTGQTSKWPAVLECCWKCQFAVGKVPTIVGKSKNYLKL